MSLQLPVRLLQHLPHRQHRGDEDVLRRHAARGVGDDAGQRLGPQLLGGAARADHQGRGAVAERRGVAGRHRAALAEGRLQLRQPLRRRLRPQPFVAADTSSPWRRCRPSPARPRPRRRRAPRPRRPGAGSGRRNGPARRATRRTWRRCARPPRPCASSRRRTTGRRGSWRPRPSGRRTSSRCGRRKAGTAPGSCSPCRRPTISSASPARIAWAASITALRPEPHTLLTVKAAMVSGRPALSAACRAGFWPTPACSTLPMMTSSTRPGGAWRGAALRASGDGAELQGRHIRQGAEVLADGRAGRGEEKGVGHGSHLK